MQNLLTRLGKYASNTSGQFAIWTAIAALPVTMAAAMAVDMRFVDRESTQMQLALDNAALAAVTHQALSAKERDAYAKERFWANFEDDNGAAVKVITSSGDRVEMVAEKTIPTLMGDVFGNDIVVAAFSEAELVQGFTVCMLALDPDSARSFEVIEGATLDANCNVQVNSLHNKASVVELGGKAVADGFCIAGGAIGAHYPYANTECSSVGDPYLKVEMPKPGPCINEGDLDVILQDWRSERDAIENHAIDEDKRWAEATAAGRVWYPTYFAKNHLKPGNYCKGLFLEGKEFILDPGVYHITDGSLVFGLGTEIIGEGVTFILHDDVNVEIRDGSVLNVQGPTEGPLMGLVIAQELADKPKTSPSYPNITTTITDGAMLNILGAVYLPSHKIEFLGGSLAKTRAPATSFIGHQISVRDGAHIAVDVDHVAAGIPPIQPRADSSARLVR